MLSIQEFNAATSAYTKRFLVVSALTVLTMFACLAAAAAYRDPLRVFYTRLFSEPVAEALMGLAPAPALIVLVAGLWLGERRAKRDARLSCPHCGKNLAGMRHLVVATRNCGYCGKRVLAEPVGPAQQSSEFNDFSARTL
jgi:hypothetical protein